MKDRTRLIRTPSARIAPFCEICGRVDGPLPFGRGEVMLSYHLSGARCQDHPFTVPVHITAPSRAIANTFSSLDDDDLLLILEG
jgi:hypothetical protein